MDKREYMTIGEIVSRLKPAYPGLSISKVRFLEDEGLIVPERTPGGYRKFTESDANRIELVLRLQRDHFLPLVVIKEKLAEYDKGRIPSEMRDMVPSAAALPMPLDIAEAIPLEDVPTALGMTVQFVRELAEYNLIELVQGDRGPEVLREDVTVLHAVWDLARFNLEPRHLRMYETFAEKEATLFQQYLLPRFRHRTPETRQKLLDTVNEMRGLTEELKRRLLQRALRKAFEDAG